MKGGILRNDKAVSPVIGGVLILAISVTIITTVQLNFVPVWNAQEELSHLEKMNDDFKELKSSIESSAVSGTALSSSLTMGFKYSPKVIAYNPRESAYATLSIQNDTWAEVRYNEVFPEGMDDATSIKNISTSTITYALQGTQNFGSFIYEHGLIRRSGSNYTASSQTLVANDSLYLLSVKPTYPETTKGVGNRLINIYPTSPPKNSVTGKNVWLILRTRYVDWWTDSNNPSSIQKQGGIVKKIDGVNGIIIAYFNSSVIRMGETQVTAQSKKPLALLPPMRLVKVTPQNINLPIEGISSLAVEVQDDYNNPVQNVVVNFNVNNSGTLVSNAFSNATLLQNSAISGADGRANILLKTGGSGMYYIDASLAEPSYKTTFVYPASSQGGFLSLAYTGSPPLYDITATLRTGTGEPDPTKDVSFATSDGTVSPSTGTTGADGKNSTTLDTTAATGIRITNIQTANITLTSANITWDTATTITVTANRTLGGYIFGALDIPTSVSSNGCVRYGTAPGNYPSIKCDALASSHSVNLTGLQPDTAYYFIVNSSRQGGASINSSEYIFVTEPLTDTTPPASITGIAAATAPLYINWTWTDPADADLDHVEVYIDGALKSNVTRGEQYYNASYFRPNSTHEISTRTVDTSGNVNSTWVNLTAVTSSVFTYVFDFLNTTGTVTNPDAAKDDSDGGASAALTEGQLTPSTTYNWSFTPPILNNESWFFNYTVTTATSSLTVSSGNTTTDGVPPGALFANISVTSNGVRTVITSWHSPNFTWNNGTPASAILNFSFKVAQFTGSGGTNNYEVFLIDSDGVKKQINQTTTFSGATAWGNFSNNSVYVLDFSKSGNYSLLLNATLSTTRVNPSTEGKIEVRWDNPNITLITPYRLNITTNTTNIPDATAQELQIRYNVSGDNFTMQLWNGSGWNNRTTLNDTGMAYRNITLLPGELIPDGTLTGNAVTLNKYYALVRYIDVNASAAQGKLYLDYQRVYSS